MGYRNGTLGIPTLVALVAEFIPAARQAGGERESRWRTATTILCLMVCDIGSFGSFGSLVGPCAQRVGGIS